MKTLGTLSIVCVLLFINNFTLAQGMTNEMVKAHMLSDWGRAKAYTKEYLDAMPEDGTNFKPIPEIRSFAEQMLHMSQGTVGVISIGTGEKPIFQDKILEKTEEYKTKTALSRIVLECYDFAIESIKNMDASKLDSVVKRGSFETNRYGWLNKAFEHQTHHRAQTTIYLRMKGIKPPNEKLF